MMSLSRDKSLSLALIPLGVITVVLMASTQGGAVAETVPQLVRLGPLAIIAVVAAGLTLASPTIALELAVLVPLLMPNTDGLGGAAVLLVVAMCKELRRRKGADWLAAGLVLATGTILVLTSYGAPIQPPPGSRLAVVYSLVVALAAALVRSKNSGLLGVGLSVGAIGTFGALSTPSLQTDRGGTVVLGLNANGLAFLCGLGLVCALLLIRRPLVSVRTAGLLSISACAFLGIIQCGSRGAFLAVVAACVTAAISRQGFSKTRWKNFAVIGAAGVVVYLASPFLMNWLAIAAGRDPADIAQNVTSRASATGFAFHAAAEYPLTGVGLSSLDQFSLSDANVDFHLSAHDVFVGRFAESGIFVGALFLSILLFSLIGAWQRGRTNIFPAVVFILVSGISLDWFVDSRTGPAAMLLVGSALPFGLGRVAREPDSIRCESLQEG